MIRDFVEAFRAGREPRETFQDGYVVNTVLDAAYRSMRSGQWEDAWQRPRTYPMIATLRSRPATRRWRGIDPIACGLRRGVDRARRGPATAQEEVISR